MTSHAVALSFVIAAHLQLSLHELCRLLALTLALRVVGSHSLTTLHTSSEVRLRHLLMRVSIEHIIRASHATPTSTHRRSPMPASSHLTGSPTAPATVERLLVAIVVAHESVIAVLLLLWVLFVPTIRR